ncbi:hypothetical protein [Amycolatopsis taiwanensis]|uniref:Uncharacterized protein n=1 Tax=Amycolatopsis taiwanensis TaxID=342230 RepID=A0A9W6QW46_9PSEU|nr:hypothetical protein [Amycolatopsis taiwanensis]GLY65126.1 hypothetical protein Atai01_17450 [Amycolatopsis taiwanensis]
MSASDGRRLDRRAAERVLGGDLAAGGPGLHALLAVASAPARPGELAGEEAAVAALHSARIEPRPAGRRRMIRTVLATLVTTRAAVAFAATAAVTVGGVVTVAAATGGSGPTVPPPAPTTAATLSRASAEPPPSAEPPSAEPPPSSASRTGERAGEQAAPPAAAHPNPNPNPSLDGLCRAYTSGAGAEHGKALDSPAFTALITAAGGKDKVADYCTSLLPTRSASPEMDHNETTPPGIGHKEIPHLPTLTP